MRNVDILKKPLLYISLTILFVVNTLNTYAMDKYNSVEPVVLPVSATTSPANQESKPLSAQVTKQDVDIESDKVDYYEDRNQFVATGSAKLQLKDQNTTLEADKITYDQLNQFVIAEKNVKITKYGKVIYGEYAKIDLTNESALINKPNTVINKIKINSESANVYTDNAELFKGTAVLENKDFGMKLSSTAMSQSKLNNGNTLDNNSVNPPVEAKQLYHIHAKEMIIDNNKKTNTNIVTIKNADVLLGKIKVAHIPYLQFSTTQNSKNIETNLPEIGHTRELGNYVGPGYVFYMPQGATLKAAPIIAYDSGGKNSFGAGGLFRYTSETNRTEVGFTTVNRKLVIDGEQQIFTPNTKLIYGSNSYIDNGLLGEVKPKYLLEVADDRLLASAYNFDLYSRVSAGYSEDYTGGWGTAKAQMQGRLINNQPVLAYKKYLQLRFESQYNVAAYGNGSTVGLIRVGPRLSSKLGPLTLSSAYYLSGIHGESPFKYDRYMSGKSNLVVNSDLKIHKYFDVGTYNSFCLTKDNWQGKLLTENQFYTRVGPQDFKFKIGYDTVRKRSVFGFDMMVGSGGRTAIDFDKLNANQLK